MTWRPAGERLALAGFALLAAPTTAAAHGFGKRYDLPVPLWLYLVGAGGAVALSFVVIAAFAGGMSRPRPAARRLPALPARLPAGEAVTAALLLLVLAAGWFGNQDPLRNLAPTAIWIIWWVGLAYVSAIVGNIWAAANPWAGMFAAAERLAGRRLSLGWRYPAWLDVWPGLALLIAFAWTELIFPYSAVPAALAVLGMLYSLVTWAGMALFSREVWLAKGEAFALAFGVFARLSPFSGDRDRPASTAMAGLVLFLLSSVMFDGLLATPLWAAVAEFIPGPPFLGQTVGLLALWLLFIASYAAVCRAMAAAAGGGYSAGEIGRAFAFTLVPIALAYHLAHYLTYLVIEGQYLIPLASDPFGRGWNLFGTAGYRVDIAIVGPRFAWLSAVAAIVLGHIAAVWLAHRKALALFAAARPRMVGQYAMTALMVGYTVTSLTILAQPIVERPTETAEMPPAQIALPTDAIVPMPGSGLFRPVGPGHTARAGLRFRVLVSPFHDGIQMDAADILYAYSFAWHWGGGAAADPAIAAATALARQRLVGLRVGGLDTTSRSLKFADITLTRALLAVEVYADLDPADPDAAAAVAPPWSAVPWTVLALMGEAETRGWAAFSGGEAARRGVPWLDLVRDEALKRRLAGLVDEFARDGYRPRALQAFVSPDAARARWQALAAYYRAHRHFLVTNGPYDLTAWSADGATLTAFRNMNYPLGVGSFDNLPIPRRAFVTKAEPVRDGLRLSAEAEALEKFARDYRLKREPLAEVLAAPGLSGPVDVACRWLLVAPDGSVALAGTARPAADGSFTLPLRGRLRPGNYTAEATVVVNGNAVDLAIARFPYSVE